MLLENGYPKTSLLATDLKDSPRFAGLLQLFGWPDFAMPDYIENGRFVRSPGDDPNDFSRDQAVCLFAGLKSRSIPSEVFAAQDLLDAGVFPNGDLMHPGIRGHIKRCIGQKSSLYEKAWLLTDIWFQDVTNYWEQNQIMAMAMVAGPWYVRRWKSWLPTWQESLKSYWYKRGEVIFCDYMIEILEKI